MCAEGGQRHCRRPDKRDAGRRPSGRRIPRLPASGKARPLCRSSYSHRTRCRWASAGALFGEVVFSGAVGGVTTPPRCESRTQRLLWPQTAEFCTAPGICFTSVFSDAEGGKAVDSRLSTLLFQIQSRRESDAKQRQKCKRSPSSAVACKPVFSMSLDIRAICHTLRFPSFATPATHIFYKSPS